MDEWLTVRQRQKFYRVTIDVIEPEALDYRIDESETAKLAPSLPRRSLSRASARASLIRERDVKLAWMPTEEEVQSRISLPPARLSSRPLRPHESRKCSITDEMRACR